MAAVDETAAAVGKLGLDEKKSKEILTLLRERQVRWSETPTNCWRERVKP